MGMILAPRSITAAVNAGAHLVTTTLWPLPTDGVMGGAATTRLALEIYRAHRSLDPVVHIRCWQLEELERWRVSSEPRNSPLLWACLVTVLARDCHG